MRILSKSWLLWLGLLCACAVSSSAVHEDPDPPEVVDSWEEGCEDERMLPGTKFGPLVGTATGIFSQLFFYYVEMPLVHPVALERLQAAGVRGLRGFRTELRFRQRNPLELLELEIPPQGRLHPDCTPERPPKCPKCGWDDFAFPEDPILDAASLPAHTDLFRLSDFESIFIATELFVDTVRRLNLEEVDFRELPTR